MGTKGSGRLFLRGRMWWLDLTVGRHRYRVSTGCVRKYDAEEFRASRLLEAGKGRLAGLKSETTFEDLARGLEDLYRAQERKAAIKYPLAHLRKAFGHLPTKDVTSDRITAYALSRRDQGAAVASVNLELSYLRRAFRLGLEADRVLSVPKVRILPGEHVRQGFLDPETFRAIVSKMSPVMAAAAEFLKLTGWREGEAVGLEWRRVDWKAGEIRLETSKSGKPRALAFAGYDALDGLLARLRDRSLVTNTQGLFVTPYVFAQSNGHPITRRGLQTAWNRARKAVGSSAMIHDLRRTLVRDMERAGVPRSVAMSVTGHQSEAVYRRYAIVARRDQEEGLRRLQELPERSVVVKMPAGQR